MPERDRDDPEPRSNVRDEQRGSTLHRAARRGFTSGASEALPVVIVVGLVGATLAAGMHAAGAGAAEAVAVAVSAIVLLGLGVALTRALSTRARRRARGARSRTKDARPKKRSSGRFSRGPYAVSLLFGFATLVGVIAYFVVDPLFTRGRHGTAAILGVIAAPIFAVIWLYDPLAALLDRWLDRLASRRAGPREDDASQQGVGSSKR